MLKYINLDYDYKIPFLSKSVISHLPGFDEENKTIVYPFHGCLKIENIQEKKK